MDRPGWAVLGIKGDGCPVLAFSRGGSVFLLRLSNSTVPCVFCTLYFALSTMYKVCTCYLIPQILAGPRVRGEWAASAVYAAPPHGFSR